MKLAVSVMLAATLLAAPPLPDPFATPARARVLLFVRTDCPITNRYAPEIQRLAREFTAQGADFWLVYPGRDEATPEIEKQIAEYSLPTRFVHDPGHHLVDRAHATVAPEAAVFNSAGRLIYHGRIDDRWIDAGKSRPAPRTHDLERAIAATLAGKPVAVPETRAIGCYLADIE
jgi:hypothetical protein